MSFRSVWFVYDEVIEPCVASVMEDVFDEDTGHTD